MSHRTLKLVQLAGFQDEDFDLPAEPFQRWFESPIRNALAPDGQKQIDIIGEIGRDIFTGGGITANWVREQLDGAGDIVVNIDSPGGSFYTGNSIYTLLAQHDGEVTVNILGMAASAASMIAMAGDKIRIAKNAAVFIHNAHGGADGDHRAMTEAASILKTIDTQIRAIYSDRTGLKDAELEKLMDGKTDGTMMVAKDAIDKGFADEILPEASIKNLGARAEFNVSPTLARRALEASAAGKVKLTRRQHSRYFDIAAKFDTRAQKPSPAAGLKPVLDDLRGLFATD